MYCFLINAKKQHKCLFYEFLEIAAKYNSPIAANDNSDDEDEEDGDDNNE